jgi:hypothetical protein
MFSTILKDQKLPGYANPITIEVSVQQVLLTDGSMRSQWSIRLPEGGAKLPGTDPAPPLFEGDFPMSPPKAIMDALAAAFAASAPELVAGLTIRAEAAAKVETDRLAAAVNPSTPTEAPA